jgi:hypothetical protein
VVFWPLFGFAGMLAVGYVTTALHVLFALLQAAAWNGSPQALEPA